jgi:hypothetical protein
MRIKMFPALALLGLLSVAWALYAGKIVIPNQWNPFAPLEIDEPLNFLTRSKLARLSRNDQLCRSVLAQAQLRYQPLPDRKNAEGCGLHNAVRVEATTARVGEAFALTCRSAVALALWETHVLQPAAQAHFGQPVARLEHFGSYSCRNVYGRETGRRSQHATADALDLAGFVLKDGRRIRVVRDWKAQGSDAEFLREIHDGACSVFDGVLGPDYNEAHRDHFHFDRGSFPVCR